MKIGIIGSGRMGSALGKLWAKAGHQVFFSSRNPEKLTDLVAQVGSNAQAGSVTDAAQFGEVIVLGVNFGTLDDAVQMLGSAVNGKLVIDLTNPIKWEAGSMTRALPEGISGGQALQQKLPQAHVYKAFSNSPQNWLIEHPHRQPDLVAMPIAGDHVPLRSIVEQLIRDAGFEPVYIGGLDQAGRMELGGELPFKLLTAAELKALVSL
jgi:hypothetical protein